MLHDTFWLTAMDHSRLFVNQWLPAPPLKAVILLAHGMAEHSARYARLAEKFCEQGYGVYAPDLRGHGKTAENGTLGHFADDDGWPIQIVRPPVQGTRGRPGRAVSSALGLTLQRRTRKRNGTQSS